MIDWKKYVDHIYVITCTKYKDRLPELYQELNRVDIDINSDLVTNIQNITTPLYQILKHHFKSVNPYMCECNGLFISTIMHYYCMKNALENEYSKILILEDDVRFLKNKDLIQYILDNSITLFNNTDKQILCCNGSVETDDFNNCEDAGQVYDIPYSYINHHKNIIRSSACNIYNTKAMKYFCDFIESFKIEPSDAYEYIYDNTVKIYVTPKHICMQQGWITAMYNTCKDYNMLYPSEEELQEIRYSKPFGYRDGEQIYQSIIKYKDTLCK